jgi:DNA-binding response OmpR family regulator
MHNNEGKPLIMAVDDDESICILLKRLIEDAGYRAITAGNGRKALTLLRQECPDMLLLDITMPGMNGLEVLHEVRQHTDIPVLMITARCEAVTIHQALVAGADDYINKPFNIDDLMARIETKLQRRIQQTAACAARHTTAENIPPAICHHNNQTKSSAILA